MVSVEDVNKVQLTPFVCWVLAFLFFAAAIVAYKIGAVDVALGSLGAAGVLVLLAQNQKQQESNQVKAIATSNQAQIAENNAKLDVLVDQLSAKSSCERPPGVTEAKIIDGKCEFETPLASLATEIKKAGGS